MGARGTETVLRFPPHEEAQCLRWASLSTCRLRIRRAERLASTLSTC